MVDGSTPVNLKKIQDLQQMVPVEYWQSYVKLTSHSLCDHLDYPLLIGLYCHTIYCIWLLFVLVTLWEDVKCCMQKNVIMVQKISVGVVVEV